MYDLILSLCNWISTFPTLVLIILAVTVSLIKILLAVRQLYTQEASEKSGFAMTSRIFSWGAFLSIAMYSWSVFYDRDIGDQETHFLIIGLIALGVSCIFGFLSKSIKIVVLDIILSIIAFVSGSLFGVLFDKWPFFWAIIVVCLIDFAIGGIAHKIGDNAPSAREIKYRQKDEHINNSLQGIYNDYYHIYHKDLPKLSEEERLIIAACCDEEETQYNRDLLYKRIWLSGTLLWYLSRKNKYYPMSEIVSKAHLQEDGQIEWTEEYDSEEANIIKTYSDLLSSRISRISDYDNYVIRIIDADELVTANTRKDYYAYVCNASRQKIGLFNPRIDWTDDFIEKINKDIQNAESVKNALTDLGDFFIGIIDLRYKQSDSEKCQFIRMLDTQKRYILLYGVVCLSEPDSSRMLDISYVRSRIMQLDGILSGTDNSQFNWSGLFEALNTALQNLGGKNQTRFNAILNNWQAYRQTFVSSINA